MPAKKKKKKKSPKLKSKTFLYRILALVCVVLAIFIFIGLPNVFKQSKNPIQISPQLYSKDVSGDLPIKIAIANVNIDLPVVNARIIDGYWETSEDTASYGLGSGIPGQKGNVVIFAHARYGLFYNLKDIKVGDIVYVYTRKSWYRYKVNNITAVYPNQIEVIKPTKTETLTLYTCTGFIDDKRLIVTAFPEN